MTGRIDPKNDPINREKKEPRNDQIHPPKNTQVIQQMYNDFMEGVDKLQDDIADAKKDEELTLLRKMLGGKAWSLIHNYEYPLDKILKEKKKTTLKSLGIVPTMGTIVPRGQSGQKSNR